MAGELQSTRFRFWLWLIALVGVIVPRRLASGVRSGVALPQGTAVSAEVAQPSAL